jgi:hypothetical protein
MFTDGNVSSSVTVSMQIVNEAQFNRDVALLDASVLNFNVNTEIFPITDIVMTGRADVSEGKVYFKASFDMNQATLLGGIAIANLKCTINGVADTIVALSLTFNSLTSEWEFETTTSFTTGDKIVVELYDSVENVAVAKIGARYYKGANAEISPVA